MDKIYSNYNATVEDKISILKSYMSKDDNGNLNFIVHRLQKKNNDGSVVEYYKACKFFRLTRVSKESLANKMFMSIHTDIMRTLFSSRVNFIEIIGNILKPKPIGLAFLYGVQSVGNTEEEAIKNCKADFQVLISAFQGTHRLDHITGVDNQIMNFIFKNLSKQKYVSVIKGIPSAKNSSGDNRNSMKLDVSTDEQLEQFLAGADQIEYCLVLMATPMDKKYINHWLTKSLDEQSKWERQKQGSANLGLSVGIPLSMGMSTSRGTSVNTGSSKNLSNTFSKSHNDSHSVGTSENTSINESVSGNKSKSTSWNEGTSTGHSEGINDSKSTGTSVGINAKIINLGQNNSSSLGSNSSDSSGTSSSQGGGTSEGSGWSSGSSISKGQSVNDGTSDGWSSGESDSSGSSFSKGSNVSQSSSFSTGANIGFNMSKSYNWIDKSVEYICELLGEQNKRLKQMANGDGGFFVDMYIATDTPEHQKSLEGVANVTWNNPNAMIDMLRLETPDIKDQKNLGMHLQALSPCMEIVVNPKNTSGYYYKFSSVLTSTELAGYCHPPRITIGGLDNATEDIPQYFSTPTNRQDKEMFIGYCLSPSRFNYEMSLKTGNGYGTDFKYTIGNDEMHHAFISGASRSGKSVLASRAVLEMYNNAPYIDKYGNVKRKRILVLDPKGEWRRMASLIPKGKFKFYSVGKSQFHPLKMNLLRVPKNVHPYNYYNLVVSHFCSAYGLLDRAIAQISSIIYELYEKNEVFGHESDPTWANEHSKNITLEDVYFEIEKALRRALESKNQHDAEALQTYLTRLDMYHRKESMEHIMFCNRGGDSADTLLGEDDFTVIESSGLSEKSMRFFFILLMNSIYEYALNSGPEGFYTNSYETVIVLEEANSVLISNEKDEAGQQSIQRFNEIIDKSASLGLFIWTITQKIASMPNSVIANSGILFVGRTAQDADVKVIFSALGFQDKKHVEIVQLLPRMAVGMFIAKCSKGRTIESQTPVLIQASMLKSTIPSDSELDVLLQEHETERLLKD